MGAVKKLLTIGATLDETLRINMRWEKSLLKLSDKIELSHFLLHSTHFGQDRSRGSDMDIKLMYLHSLDIYAYHFLCLSNYSEWAHPETTGPA